MTKQFEVKPFGTYSMCAVISADDRAIDLAKLAEGTE